jgi:hypothetical protein
MRQRLFATLIALIATLLVGSTALAGGNGAQTYTETEHGVTQTEVDNSGEVCGLTGTVTYTYNAVFHITQLANGTYHVTGTTEATFTFVADTGVTYTGHFAQWFGENSNQQNAEGTFTFTVIGRGSDGSTLRFHETAHFSVSASGADLTFDKISCSL